MWNQEKIKFPFFRNVLYIDDKLMNETNKPKKSKHTSFLNSFKLY